MALAFIIFAGVSAGVFFLFLCYTIYRVFLTIATKQVSQLIMINLKLERFQDFDKTYLNSNNNDCL